MCFLVKSLRSQLLTEGGVFVLAFCGHINTGYFSAEVDGDIRALVSQGHLPGHVPSARHCSLGWREIQTNPEIQPPGGSAH